MEYSPGDVVQINDGRAGALNGQKAVVIRVSGDKLDVAIGGLPGITSIGKDWHIVYDSSIFKKSDLGILVPVCAFAGTLDKPAYHYKFLEENRPAQLELIQALGLPA